jgi:putative phosphoribosyl transferase
MRPYEIFEDRDDAAVQLAARLRHLAGRDDLLVLGLPRGGVAIAAGVARELKAALDVMVVRKLGVPGHEEFAMGALASGGIRVMSESLIRRLRIPASDIERVVEIESRELERRERLYRGDRPPLVIAGRTVVLVDDGIATGSTMKAAVRAVRAGHPGYVVVAAPVASATAAAELREMADETVFVQVPDPFYAVGIYYGDFPQLTDDDVHERLDRAGGGSGLPRPEPGSA